MMNQLTDEMNTGIDGSHALFRGVSVALGLAVLVLACGGCRAHPVTLATMVVGDLISDKDVENRQEKLMGQLGSAADVAPGSPDSC